MTDTYTAEQVRNIAGNSFLIRAALGWLACHFSIVKGWRKRAFEALSVAEKWQERFEQVTGASHDK